MKQPLSVIVPCRNERRNIRPCIKSFYRIADEVLVADSGSTDGTLDIVREYSKVRVISRDYKTSGDFKNWAIPQALHPWVLIVDADERVPAELCDEIELELSRGPSEDGYWINRNNYFMGHRLRFGDARTDKVLRLFRRDQGRYFGPSDHGQVRISSGRIGSLRHAFEHYTIWTYDQAFRKMHRYTTLQAYQWHEQNRDTSYFKLLIRPMFRFFRELILQGSILDGKAGIQTAWLAAFYSFTKQARLWELNHALPQPEAAAEEQSNNAETELTNRAA
jgi:(heptosyl)LPS beta-1,4-glucosyltransferase